jgi:rare lipoprotein A
MDRTAPIKSVKRRQSATAQGRPAPPGATFHLLRRLGTAPLLLPVLFALLLQACTSARPALRPSNLPELGVARGVASWYGPGFHGRRTASGERYDMHDLTAAHPKLPFGTLLEVRNTVNGRSVLVRVNDRGPFAKRRVIDLSYAAALALGMVGPGTAEVELAVIDQQKLAEMAERYTVQVGAFSDSDRAVDLHRDIKRIYPEAFVHSDGIWNRVQVGLFKDRDNAEALRRELAVMGVPAVVVAAH